MKLISLKVMLVGGSLLGCAGLAGAAPITWVDDGQFSSENDINMTGTVVNAAHGARIGQFEDTYHVGTPYGIVSFEPMGAESYANSVPSTNASVPVASGIYGTDSIYQQGGSDAFDNAMDTSIYNNGKTNDAGETAFEMELVISNLTVGVEYQVQVFKSSENNDNPQIHNYCYFSDSSVAFEGNITSTNLVGQAAYGTGRFTADATTQSVYAHQTGAVDDGTTEIKLGASMNAYVLLKAPFVLPPIWEPLEDFSITSIEGGAANVITFEGQFAHFYSLWGSEGLNTNITPWVELTTGIEGLVGDTSVTNTPPGNPSPYFYKVIGL